ncbi:Glutamyl-tRNA(Gln) amidotransferase subunit B [Alternaria arborescens]|uniref:Glutamyl-tRNA(Gln) amidotransferase subunit B, mitochondrial n=1 Tax=Alternaria arborescens TaxID=156630 RepID=A0A4Q4QDQ9_9PLEO|nr:Glutamyl-tRNA(Gln) amidotransferase subunit B [Alternaria arborescens]
MFARTTRNTLATASKQPYICHSCLRRVRQSQLGALHLPTRHTTRSLQTETQPPPPQDGTAFRKLLKDAAKQQKKDKSASAGSSKSSKKGKDARLEKWELTVGIEVHAELNTARKLFSSAATSISELPNTHVSLFDVAFPGTQPHFQKETLLPALRAAIAFDCEIQHKSSFDRKHYFYQDQPAGYQTTQYYEPFAKNGKITLYPHDFPPGAAPQPEPFDIGIKQIQMEQDTAKTVQQPPSTHLLDFNRVSHPLIEIITLPQIHDPTVAAVVVRKIQNTLKAVNACTTGMELGGLRADVNVSVRQRGGESSEASHSYSGVTGLGQRTEIKNLSSTKAVEDAIIAERDRQIDLIESGGAVEGETRGWTLGSKTTKRLRGKEGEIDYRYMPDPDIAPVFIGKDLVEHLRNTLPKLPDVTVDLLANIYGLTTKDAITLLSLDDGERLEYFADVVRCQVESEQVEKDVPLASLGKTTGNWVLMELGSLFQDEPWDPDRVPADYLANVISHVRRREVTSPSAKRLLAIKFEGDPRSATEVVHQENLLLQPLSQEEYVKLAQTLLEEKPDMVRDITEKGQVKKVGWFVGQMVIRAPDGSVEPDKAKEVLLNLLDLGE